MVSSPLSLIMFLLTSHLTPHSLLFVSAEIQKKGGGYRSGSPVSFYFLRGWTLLCRNSSLHLFLSPTFLRTGP